MNKILIYTFKTFPWIEDLKQISPDIVILNKPKEDIEIVKEKLLNYDLVLGIARARRYSTFETKAVNIFHKRELRRSGKKEYLLSFPKEKYDNIYISNRYSTTFCNWAMYNTAEHIDKIDLEIKHYFVHILRKDITSLAEFSHSTETFL